MPERLLKSGGSFPPPSLRDFLPEIPILLQVMILPLKIQVVLFKKHDKQILKKFRYFRISL